MSAARSFRSVFMVASCAGAALGCYLVSLNVASERASLEDVENRIVMTQRDIRMLQTEIGTRGRLAQLERWNVKVLALSAPSADQFLEGGFQLARLAQPEPAHNVEAPVVMASVPAPPPQSAPLEEGDAGVDGAGASSSAPAARLMREASLKIPVREAVEQQAVAPQPKKVVESAQKTEVKSVKSVSDVRVKTPQTKPVVNEKKAGDKKLEAAAKPVTKPVRLAKVDPLAPLPANANSKKTAKDSGSAR
ncbi:hypothetical protein [Sphingomonas daechungensis]|uniref:hypothetical protein n=1 Tax=Sphingomonas daechungensis TaxID=1176646 RepID=UPI003783C4E3